MTHLSPDGGTRRLLPPTINRPSPALAHPLSRRVLDWQIALRRARLTELEARMIAACEAAALGSGSPPCTRLDRESWDRSTWHRYLAAAMRLETTYGPPMRRLRQDIARLERLKALPIAA
ncbi:MAG TPA: hypothetical protein VMU82_04650 [Acetobacteraceae bacterium]|nr:hypothetical protein [Acetobacteraceae bacterium]